MSSYPRRWRLIGTRVRAMRLAHGWTQRQMSRQMLMGERSLSSLERGRRMPTAGEMQMLASLAGQNLDYFTDPLVLTEDAKFCWRAGSGPRDSALEQLEQRARQWVGLLRWLHDMDGGPHATLERPALRLNHHSTHRAARERGEMLAQELGLGPLPGARLEERVAAGLGTIVLHVDERLGEGLGPRGISCVVCQSKSLDVVLLNRHRPPGSRLFCLARALFYLLGWNKVATPWREVERIDFRVAARKDKSPSRLADHFALGLLTPAAALDELVHPNRHYGPKYLAQVARRMRVAPRVLSWRLREHKRIGARTLEKLAQRVEPVEPRPPRLLSDSFVHLLLLALHERVITQTRAAQVIGLHEGEKGRSGGLAALLQEYGVELPRGY